MAPQSPTPHYTVSAFISYTWNVFPSVAVSELPVLASKQWLMGVISSSHSTLVNVRTSCHGSRKAVRKNMKTGYALRRLYKMQSSDEHHGYVVRVRRIFYSCCHVITWCWLPRWRSCFYKCLFRTFLLFILEFLSLSFWLMIWFPFPFVITCLSVLDTRETTRSFRFVCDYIRFLFVFCTMYHGSWPARGSLCINAWCTVGFIRLSFMSFPFRLFVSCFLPGYTALHFTGDYCDTVIPLYPSKVRHGHGRSLTEGKALWQHNFNHSTPFIY